jgi:hypothetical protein
LDEPHNSRLLKLLYRLAEWHAFAKMRLHTESTLRHLETLTTELGQLMRDFEQSTCSHFQTFELPREVEARKRRYANAHPSGTDSNIGVKRTKSLNLFTYKWHSLADYVPAIRLFGGVDGFSTQLVSRCFYLDLTNLISSLRENSVTDW